MLGIYNYLLAIHIVSVLAWVAALFILPRLFVYHREAIFGVPATDSTPAIPARPEDMPLWHQRERRSLYFIMHPAATVAIITGVLMVLLNPVLLDLLWMRLFLIPLAMVLLYQGYCSKLLSELAANKPRSNRFYRIYNEIVAIPVIAMVGLAIIKPV